MPQPKLGWCAFARAHLKRGEAGQVALQILAKRLRYWDTAKNNTS